MKIIDHVQHAGRHLALVPLGRFGSKGYAVIEADDLNMVEALGLSLAWNRNQLTGTVFAPAVKASGGNVQVARVLLDLGEGQIVKYLSGDPTDLRRQNLSVVDGNAIRKDRDFLTPKAERRPWGPAIEHRFRTPITVNEVDAAMTENKAWTKAQLAEWGVPWPPPKGWKQQILRNGYPYDDSL